MSAISQLIDAIRDRALELSLSEQNDYAGTPAEGLMRDAIRQANIEVRDGAPTSDFVDLVVINFIVLGAREGKSSEELRELLELVADPSSEMFQSSEQNAQEA